MVGAKVVHAFPDHREHFNVVFPHSELICLLINTTSLTLDQVVNCVMTRRGRWPLECIGSPWLAVREL